jgi:hypothetical protein
MRPIGSELITLILTFIISSVCHAELSNGCDRKCQNDISSIESYRELIDSVNEKVRIPAISVVSDIGYRSSSQDVVMHSLILLAIPAQSLIGGVSIRAMNSVKRLALKSEDSGIEQFAMRILSLRRGSWNQQIRATAINAITEIGQKSKSKLTKNLVFNIL